MISSISVVKEICGVRMRIREKNGWDARDGQECQGGRREPNQVKMAHANPTSDLLDSITRIPDNFLFDLLVLGSRSSSRGSFHVLSRRKMLRKKRPKEEARPAPMIKKRRRNMPHKGRESVVDSFLTCFPFRLRLDFF